MIRFSYFLSNIFKILRTHKFLSFLIILLVFISQFLLGLSVDIKQTTDESASSFDETYGEKTFFFSTEFLSDSLYYRYMEDGNDNDFNRLLNFKNKLNNSTDFSYTEIGIQPLEIINTEIPDFCLWGYTSGNYSSSIYQDSGNTTYTAEGLYVSEPFFNDFSIEISEGNTFSEEDYIYSEGKEIPVLLGNAYKDSLNTGDKFEAYYYGEKMDFTVKGFIKEQNFFYSQYDHDFVSCERYVVIPSMKMDTGNRFTKSFLLQQVCGMITSTLGYEKTSEIFNRYMNDCGIGEWKISIKNPNPVLNSRSVLDTYSAMTNEVAYQFQILVVIILAFGCVAITAVICNMLKENHQTFGISLLCGASFGNIAAEVVGLVALLLLSGDLCASWALFIAGAAPAAHLTVQIAVAATTFVSCVSCILYLKKMDISDIIGGKE